MCGTFDALLERQENFVKKMEFNLERRLLEVVCVCARVRACVRACLWLCVLARERVRESSTRAQRGAPRERGARPILVSREAYTSVRGATRERGPRVLTHIQREC